MLSGKTFGGALKGTFLIQLITSDTYTNQVSTRELWQLVADSVKAKCWKMGLIRPGAHWSLWMCWA